MRQAAIAFGALVAAACGGGKAGPATPVVEPAVVVDAAVPPPAVSPKQRAVLDEQARKLDRVADDLQALADSYGPAADSVTAIHAAPQWKQRVAKATAYVVVKADRLAEVAEHAKLLGLAYQQTAAAMRAPDTDVTHVADALDQLSAQLSSTYHDWFNDLRSDLIGEVQFDSALCRKPATGKRGARDIDPICTYIGPLSGASQLTLDFGQPARAAIDDAVDAVQRAFADKLDPHATTALLRAVGDGPAYGEPCGLEKLCAWGTECMAATSTCEDHCSTSAESPCSAGLSCVAVPALGGTFCRPPAQ